MIEIGIYSAFATIFLNYIIGKPGSQFSDKEIFSRYTLWLVKNRLKKLGLYNDYEKQAGFENIARVSTMLQRKSEFNAILYSAAEPFFTWERAVGMCSVCTGVWVSIVCGIIFSENILVLPIIVAVSHVTIRLFNKFVYD